MGGIRNTDDTDLSADKQVWMDLKGFFVCTTIDKNGFFFYHKAMPTAFFKPQRGGLLVENKLNNEPQSPIRAAFFSIIKFKHIFLFEFNFKFL